MTTPENGIDCPHCRRPMPSDDPVVGYDRYSGEPILAPGWQWIGDTELLADESFQNGFDHIGAGFLRSPTHSVPRMVNKFRHKRRAVRQWAEHRDIEWVS